jgi:hypothetical protein
MTTVARVFAVSTTVALLSAPAFAQDVTHDVRQGQNFSELRTFSIQSTAPVTPYRTAPWDTAFNLMANAPSGVRTYRTAAWDSAFDQEQTNAAVAAQLQARGLRRDDVHPDVQVTTYREFVDESYGYGWWPEWGYGYGGHFGYWGDYGYGSYDTGPMVSSTLHVDIRSSESGELLWRGISKPNWYSTSNSEHQLKRINKEVTKMFRAFPAGTVATSGRETPQTTDR